jgi:hypothetical protein
MPRKANPVLIQETNSGPPGGHAGAFDVLFPTQEQVAVLAAAGVGTAVPSFAAAYVKR